jgi:small conductance mechanosensitive channel
MSESMGRRRALFVSILASAMLLLLAMPIYADDAEAEETAEADETAEDALLPLSDEEMAALDLLLEGIDADQETIEFLARRVASTEGLFQSVSAARLDKISAQRFASILEMARMLAKLDKDGKDSHQYRRPVEQDLGRLPAAAFAALERIGSQVSYPSDSADTVEFVAADLLLLNLLAEGDSLYQLLIDFVSVSEMLDLDVSEERAKIASELANAAANRSIFLEMSIKRAANYRASTAILPENTELAAAQKVAAARVKQIAVSLQKNLALMSQLGIDDRRYRQQVLKATGEITTDVLDVDVIASLISEWSLALGEMLIEQGPKLILKILLIFIIVYVAIRLSRLVEMGINRGLDTSKVQISHLLRRMVVLTGKNLVVMLGLLIALSQLGISLGPLLAGLGIAGFIIGFAMQDALSNFASGMLILFYRPFDVGDTVEAGGVRGKVRSMSLVNTTIMTFDNQSLVIPNNLIWSSVITNVTAQRTRRVDLTFGISYADDIENAERVFREIVTANDKVLSSPEPMIHLHELADSSVNFIVRPWVKTDDYWDVYWEITKAVKLRLDAEGISIPFPQRDVHVHEASSVQTA